MLNLDDALPPGHPATRSRVADCIIQRDAGIYAAESALRFAVVAQVSGGDNVFATADVHSAIAASTGTAPAELSVKPFYPHEFLILCGSQATRDRVLTATPLPMWNTSLVLCPWTRITHAELSVLLFKVNLAIEGLPPHIWTGVKTQWQSFLLRPAGSARLRWRQLQAKIFPPSA
jgi:hypothetical protein